MVIGMNKVIKIEFLGEKELTELEENLLQVAIMELGEGSLPDYGIIFDQPISISNGVTLKVEYPSDIKKKFEEPAKRSIHNLYEIKEKDYIRDYILMLEKLVTKYSGKSLSECILEGIK